jgi:hypothetical protein
MKPTGWRTDTGCRSTRRSSDAPAPIHAIITRRPGEQSPCIGCARPYIWRMPSSKYALFEQAMRTGKQVVCVYKGLPWEVCPIILGHSQGKRKRRPLNLVVAVAKGCRLTARGAACFWQKSVTSDCAMARGSPTRAIANRQAASRRWIWTSIQPAHTGPSAASHNSKCQTKSPPRVPRSGLSESIIVKLRKSVLGRPGSDLLFQALRLSTIGAEGFNGRVRDGNGFRPLARTTRSAKNGFASWLLISVDHSPA